MLNTQGTPRIRAASHPDTPSGSGGDMTMTASGPKREATPAIVAAPVKPTNPAARAAMLVLSVGNGFNRVIQPQSVDSVRHIFPCHSGSTSCRRYHGSEVTMCIRCPRAARASATAVITSPVGATSGAKWGQRMSRFTARPS